MTDPFASADDYGPQDMVAPALPTPDHGRPRGDGLLVDESWRVREVGTSSDLILGWTRQELLNSSMLERTHPDDVPALLFALARAPTDPRARALVRVRHHDHSWRSVEIAAMIVTDDDRALVAFALTAGAQPAVPLSPSVGDSRTARSGRASTEDRCRLVPEPQYGAQLSQGHPHEVRRTLAD
jgi:PAS domain-containing protein